MIQEWKEIKGTQGKYFISDHGQVMSRTSGKPRILKPRVNHRGYQDVNIRMSGVSKCKTVHRLVALAFLPERDSRCVVNHKDGNKLNNHFDNLELVSHAENIKHAYDNGLISKSYGKNNGMNKISADQVKAIRALIDQDFDNKFIATQFNVNPTTIYDIKIGKTWSWLKTNSSSSTIDKDEK